ncbi:MAG: SDR family oxidoreductase, partial [Chloroflexi bacterium]|nr:SDR family oxidoreductase [Chloroflexota bacterium]
AGKTGSANTLAYCAACFAQVGMTQTLARELGPHGINVNCVCPGAVDTARMDDLVYTEAWDEMARATPIGRNGTDEEVGNFVAYLCTKAASWIHGQSINIDGGDFMEH